MLKQFLLDNMFNSDATPNIAKFKNDCSWIKKYHGEKIYQQILDQTSFLKPDCKFSERLYCIVNEITEITKCTFCNNTPLHFMSYPQGYLSMCKSCVGKERKLNIEQSNKSKIKNTKLRLNEIIDIIRYVEPDTNCSNLINHFLNNNYNLGTKTFIKYKSETSFLFNKTNFIPIPHSITKLDHLLINVRVWHIQNGIYHIPFCDKCGKQFNFANCIKGYYTNCVDCNGVPERIKTTERKIIEKIKDSKFEILTEYTGRFNPVLIKCKVCNFEFEKILKNGSHLDFCCPKCNPFRSSQEDEICDFLLSKQIGIERSKRIYINKQSFREIDIFLPEYNIGIEHNGLYWHSETNGKDKKYHLHKSNLCKSNGINLLHIFEDEFHTKRDILYSIILSKCGIYENRIYARKCNIEIIQSKIKTNFLNNNHLQGNCNSKINIGLKYQNQLVAIACFGKRKITGSKENNWELLRFCNAINTQIVGGAKKLLNYFINNYVSVDETILTYADKRFYHSNFYEQLGFTHSHTSQPNYWYVKANSRFHRSNFQKHKLKNLLKNFDPSISEKQNMTNNGYYIIWDCGNEVYKLTKK